MAAKPTCPHCGQTFWDLDRHLAKPHTTCPTCGLAFVGFLRHKRLAHGQTTEQRQARGLAISQGMQRRKGA